MPERKWTAEQSAAINTRDKTLLVSAAAGSGKTATLTERIIRTLLDTENKTSITELLVVTFTNAAAAEMRQRITDSLKDACAKNPENQHLSRQLMLLPAAKIRTIDSFCSDLLRMNADKVGIAPNYRILDTAEGQLLAFQIFEGLINAIYDGELPEVASPEEFEALADCLTGAQNMQSLSEVLFELYERTSCEEHQFEGLDEYRESCNPKRLSDKESITFIAFYMRKLGELCEYAQALISSIVSELSHGDEAERAYTDAFLADADIFRGLSAVKSYRGLCDAMAEIKWCAVPRKKAGTELTELQVSARERRDIYKDALKELCERGFSYSDGELEYCFSGLYARLGTLISVLRRFDSLFMAEKRRRAGFSYNDIERFTYMALWQNGERTDTAESLRAQYKYVYIDEYQDVNELQDKIFEAVSRPDNRFMVGDIKQSIYGFRGAEPDIFARMKKTLPKLGDDGEASAFGLFMSENFRCDKGIIDCVNGIFDKIFGVIGEGIGYMPEDSLKYGKGAIQTAPTEHVPRVTVISSIPADEEEKSSLEPAAVAAEIKRLIAEERLNSGKQIRPGDIAIIMRKAQKAQDYAEALVNAGIPAQISGEKNFFLNREVLLALCLLNSIDNPRRDIYLGGLMRSPLYDFSADELLLIAKEGTGSMYTSLVKYTESNPEFKKGTAFLSAIRKYRRIAESASASALLYRLYRETGLLALAAKNGGKDNLTLLYNYARDFESKEYKGLYAFISFVNELIANNTQFDTKQGSGDADEVRIITTHSSKGLEYPVVFYAESASSLYPSANRGPSNIRLAKGFGMSFPLRTMGGTARVESICDRAIKDLIKERTFEEEMRVLYVALTRARERLYIFGKDKEPEEYLAKMSEYGEVLTPFSVKKLSTALDVICATRPEALYSAEYGSGEEQTAPIGEEKTEVAEPAGAPTVTQDELIRRFTYKYPYSHISELPEKMSVSRLSPVVLDGTDDGAVELFEAIDISEDDAEAINTDAPSDAEGTEEKRTYPAFFTGKPADESAKRGIATHLFMQFCDLENLRDNGAEAELLRLAERGFISPADKERVRLYEIKLFTRSELFRNMLSAKRIYRELRFNVRMPAEHFTESEERRALLAGRRILVQGVIDCIIENERGELYLVDYKTDRLSRAELADRALAARTLKEKHKTQLGYYTMAIESIFSRRPKSVQIYSLPLGESVEL